MDIRQKLRSLPSSTLAFDAGIACVASQERSPQAATSNIVPPFHGDKLPCLLLSSYCFFHNHCIPQAAIILTLYTASYRVNNASFFEHVVVWSDGKKHMPLEPNGKRVCQKRASSKTPPSSGLERERDYWEQSESKLAERFSKSLILFSK